MNNLSDFRTTGSTQGLEHTDINSSAGVVTETLAASTGGGVTNLYVNEDVTNTATLAVQSGETLNGVTDGTFLFSNYTAGTQFRADEVTGGWVVSVVGASTQTDLHYFSMLGQAAYLNGISPATLSGSTADAVVDMDNTAAQISQYDPFAMANGTDNTVDIKQSGRYRVFFSGNDTSSETGLAIFLNTVAVHESYSGNNVIAGNHDAALEVILDLAAGDKLEFGYRNSADNNNIGGGSIIVQQLPKAESVLAGMVTPAPLDRESTFDLTQVTVPELNTNPIVLDFVSTAPTLNNVSLLDGVAQRIGTHTHYYFDMYMNRDGGDWFSLSFDSLIPTGGKVIELNVVPYASGRTNPDDISFYNRPDERSFYINPSLSVGNTSHFRVRVVADGFDELVESTVVLPDAITPEPLANGEASLGADIDLSVANLGIYQDVVSVTVPNTGRYLLTGHIMGTIVLGDDVDIWAGITDGADAFLKQSPVHSATDTSRGSSYVETGATTIPHYVDAIAGDTFKLRASQNTNGTQNLIRAGSSLTYQQIPNSTVVDPGNVPVEDSRVSEVVAANTAVALGLLEVRFVDFGTSTDRQTEIRVSSGTADLTNYEASYLRHDGTGNEGAPTTKSLTTAWSPLWEDSTLNLDIASSIEFATFTYNGERHKVKVIVGEGYDRNEIIVERTTQKSVVQDNAATVIDDDTMATATDTNVPSAESIKAYVDANAVEEITSQVGLAAAVGTAAPTDAKLGIDPVTADQLYVDNSGDWQLVPSAFTGTAGSIPFSNGTSLTEDTANLFWDDTNNRLGIGTTSPDSALHINNPEALRLTNGANGLRIVQNSGTNWGVDLNVGTTDSFSFTDGNIGVGTTNPLTRLTIQEVAGDVLHLRGRNSGGADLTFFGDTTGHTLNILSRDDLGTINANGGITIVEATAVNGSRIGIGTSAPSESLDVVGSIEASERLTFSTDFANPATGVASLYNQAGVGITASGAAFEVRTGGTPVSRLRIDGTGNVGIGTSTPDDTLHIAGTFKLVDGTEAAGSVLTSDADGVGTWQAAGGSAFMSKVMAGNQTVGTATDIAFSNIQTSNGMTGTGNSISLIGGETYHVRAVLQNYGTTTTSTITYAVHDAANAIINMTGNLGITSTHHNAPSSGMNERVCDFIYTPASNVDIKVRTAGGTINGGDNVQGASSFSAVRV